MGGFNQEKGEEKEEKEEHQNWKETGCPGQGRMGESKLTDRCHCLDKELVADLA